MDTAAAADRWALTWRRAWPDRDVRAVVGLYRPDAVHRSAPFREPYAGESRIREYFLEAFASETARARVWFGEPVVTGDRAAVEWWAEAVGVDGPSTLAGHSLVQFDESGLIVEQRDYWHETSGHVARPFRADSADWPAEGG
jgi:ketosteroid isomerase-like protein